MHNKSPKCISLDIRVSLTALLRPPLARGDWTLLLNTGGLMAFAWLGNSRAELEACLALG